MPRSENIVRTNIIIKVAGSAITSETMAHVTEAMVDQHTHLPHMFTIRIFDAYDALNESFPIIDNTPFELTKEVEIIAVIDTVQTPLIKGEITALEPEFSGSIAYLNVRGYDKSHRLYRETKTTAHLNKKDSDLASMFAGNVGLSSQIETTNTVYDCIYQDNQTDLAFLMERAWRIGYECFVQDGKLYFRKPPSSSGGTDLKFNEDLLSFTPRVSLAEQVNEVIVKGWDIEKQEPILGQATTGALYPSIGDSQNGAARAGTFGTGKKIIVDMPVVSQAEATLIAQARLNEVSGAFIEAEGQAFLRPDIVAGQVINVSGIGTRFSGNYIVTQARHNYNTEGWYVDFAVRGTRTGLIHEQVTMQRPLNRWLGVVIGIVTNTEDPKEMGRVKVKFPWMSTEAESDWARVISIGAGPTQGFYAIPEVNDEVVVAFEHGDINHPFVLGGVWNDKNAIPTMTSGAGANQKPLIRGWQSATGNYIVMHDDDAKKIEIATAEGHIIVMDDANKLFSITTSGGHVASFDDQNKKLEISSSGGHKITMDDNGRKIVVESAGDVEVSSSTNMTIKSGANLDIEATGNLNIKANGLGEVSSTGPMTVKSAAILTVQGSLVKIN